MRKPNMILFDFGHTLGVETGWDADVGTSALFSHAIDNRSGCSDAQAVAAMRRIFSEYGHIRETMDCDLSARTAFSAWRELLGLRFSLTPLEQELVFWNAAAAAQAPMPHIETLLRYLRGHGIRSGVVSNLFWSGEALCAMLARLLPDNGFEFVMCSSDYVFRKPHPLLFQIALQKAELTADAVWYCGDLPRNDAAGAAGAGLFPVWYDNKEVFAYEQQSESELPDTPLLHIHDWRELIDVLERTQEIADTATL